MEIKIETRLIEVSSGSFIFEFTNSLDIYNKGISLPSYPGLKRKEIEFICGKINNYLENF